MPYSETEREAKPQLTAEQLAALQRWAKQFGRAWKSKLRHAWFSGGYGNFNGDSAPLQQVRNAFGPSWLVAFKLPPA